MQLDGRTAIVTGASSGIGQETVREFARRRAHVVLASRNRDALEKLAGEIEGYPGRCLVVPTDVTDRLAVEALIRRTVEEFDGVDVLVNNAGIGLFAPIVGGSLDNMHHLFAVNFWGAIHCIQAAVPFMRRRGRGHIVNVSSVAGKVAVPYLGLYSATKHALAAVSTALRSELADSGIGVSTVYPGITDTGFQENMLREVQMPEPPSYVPTVHAAAVARRIAQAVRWNLRDTYVTLADFAAVSAYPLAPGLADWAMRRLWLTSAPAAEVEGEPPVPAEQGGETSEADTSEPPIEPQ